MLEVGLLGGCMVLLTPSLTSDGTRFLSCPDAVASGHFDFLAISTWRCVSLILYVVTKYQSSPV